ncbi:sulfite exporter TauE/SafE family protein [Actinomarinicola tropica]|uniref:sulfite exporter TauE/SafE family protein n=1 Tax=Actinomarinicola tropica TaxID=2789776 RepID=UPI001899065D|nr:sulfite exporter TauE/SafE family protein [Actinomarinicola tropica]
MIDVPWLVVLAVGSAAVGALGGLGGAVFLVPALVVGGVEPIDAAPLGLISVAAGSLAAAPRQLEHGLVHHRLGITLEVAASAAAVVAAVVSSEVSGDLLRVVLAVSAGGAGVAGLLRSEVRNVALPEFAGEPPAEWPGTLGGAYAGPGGVIPYRARNVPQGLVAMVVAGAITGLSGVSAGFVKTPAMRELMYIPVKVAAATTTFTVGITAATSLLVFAGQGRIDVAAGSAVALGGLVGGVIGAAVQERLSPKGVRRALSIVLVVVAVVVLVDP